MKWPDDLKESLEPSYGAPGRKFVGVAYEESKMKLTPQQQEQYKDKTLNDKPKLILASLNGELPPKDENWLKDIEVGTIFLAKHKDVQPNNPVRESFELMWKSEDSQYAFLTANEHMTQPTDKKMVMYVESLPFCRQYTHLVDLTKVSYDG